VKRPEKIVNGPRSDGKRVATPPGQKKINKKLANKARRRGADKVPMKGYTT
jgi:hypothetical protein